MTEATGMAYYRKKAGLTQVALAKAIGTDEPRLIRIEKAVEIPTEEEVDKLVDLLGVPPSYIFDKRILDVIASRSVERRAASA